MSSRTWRACCLAPALAIGSILLLVVGASLFNSRPASRHPAPPRSHTREAFIQFGREFFVIAKSADKVSEQAFKTLQSKIQGSGSMEEVHSAFQEASDANRRASDDFMKLKIPQSLQSQSKLRLSVATMSKAYYARKLACDILVEWNGDLNDQQTGEKYRRQVEDINRLTQEGLGYLADAANDNGVTEEDARRFVPSAIFSEKNVFNADQIPWRH